MQYLLVFAGDLHTGSTTGLCTPVVNLPDGGEYHASPYQLWAWKSWLDVWDEVKALGRGRKTIVVLMGDLCDGDHHGTYQIITRHQETNLEVARDILDIPAAAADKLVFVHGTPVHVGSCEATLANEYKAQHIVSGTLVANGRKFHVAHHPEACWGRPWTSDGALARIRGIVLQNLYDSPPDVVVRAHRHALKISDITERPLVVITPAWQAPTEYVYRIGDSTTKLRVGLVYFVVGERGELQVDTIQRIPPRAAPIEL